MSAPTATPRLVLDNRVNVSDSFDALVRYSGVNVSQYEITPDGSNFPTQILYNNIVTPNSATTLVSRNFRQRYVLSITYDRTDLNAPQFAGVQNYNAAGLAQLGPNPLCNTVLRAPFALQSVCDNVSLTINSQTLNLPSRIVLDAFAQKLPRDYLKAQASEAPSQLDNRWYLQPDYSAGATGTLTIANGPADWAAVVAAGAVSTTINGAAYIYTPTGAAPPAVGTILPITAPNGNVAFVKITLLWTTGAARNIGTIYTFLQNKSAMQPLSAYENCDGASRACFLPVSVSNNGNNCTVKFAVSEQVYISPLTLHDQETGFANVNTLSLLFNYSSLNDILYSVNPTVAIGSIVVESPKLQLTYLQVNPDVVKIPASVSYNYDQVVYFQKNQPMTLNAYPAISEGQLQSDTLRLSACPSLIYILARPPISNRTIPDTQTFYGLGHADYSLMPAGIQITFGNRTGLLSSASSQTMYRMAKKNGYSGSFDEWVRSGLYIINPVADLGIDPTLDFLPLETGAENFQVSLYANANGMNAIGLPAAGSTPQVELLVVCVYAGAVSITPDMMFQSIGLLSHNEMNALVGESGKTGNMISSEHVKPTIQGAGLFSDAKHLLGKMASAVRSPLGQKALEFMSKMK